MNIGQVCIKIAGRDAGNTAIVIDVIDDNFVIVDGNVRRKRCNIRHLEPLDKNVKIAKNISTEEVLEALKKLNLPVIKGKQASYVKKVRKSNEKPVKEAAVKNE